MYNLYVITNGDPEVGTKAEATNECYLLAGLFLLVYSAFFFYTSQDHPLRGDAIHSGLVLPASIISQENAPQVHLGAILMKATPQSRLTLPRCFEFVSSW